MSCVFREHRHGISTSCARRTKHTNFKKPIQIVVAHIEHQ